ncbi:MAG: DUF4440 domain-containing protein, partial [Deltaproteobacteria bacterium]|nr:DUF4440 domain-containing protein [Deltaproteobacteria bacterium]
IEGDKLARGDKKTPEGYYVFRQKLLPEEMPDIYGVLAYPMDYPNFWDQRLGRGGDGIWTHGVNKPLVDFDSLGCVELLNHDLAALEDSIRLFDTPILVVESLSLAPAAAQKREATAVRDFLESWRRAWVEENHVQYSRHYAPDFVNSENASYAAWMEKKKRLATHYQKITVELEDIRIFWHRDVILASFVQRYSGDNRFTSVGQKRLYIGKTPKGYRILAEEFDNLPGKGPDKRLTAAQKEAALTTPPLAVASLTPPVVVAAAGSWVEPPFLAERPSRTVSTKEAINDESARAALEAEAAHRIRPLPLEEGLETQDLESLGLETQGLGSPRVKANQPSSLKGGQGADLDVSQPRKSDAPTPLKDDPAVLVAQAKPQSLENNGAAPKVKGDDSLKGPTPPLTSPKAGSTLASLGPPSPDPPNLKEPTPRAPTGEQKATSPRIVLLTAPDPADSLGPAAPSLNGSQLDPGLGSAAPNAPPSSKASTSSKDLISSKNPSPKDSSLKDSSLKGSIPMSPNPKEADQPTVLGLKLSTRAWLAAWNARDEVGYFAFYAPDFYFPEKKIRLAAFKKYRGRLMKEAKVLKVDLENLTIKVTGDTATATFRQRYQSDGYRDVGLKTLTFKLKDGQWLIVLETFKPLK